jgi:4-carboxymuconolactone decarboxylase
MPVLLVVGAITLLSRDQTTKTNGGYMRLKIARIAPVPEKDWSDEQKELTAPFAARGRIINIFRTFLHSPRGMKAFLTWGNYILGKHNSLPPRERELVILRTGFLCKSGYEWTQHVPIGKAAGLTDIEIVAIKTGPEAQNWSEADKALMLASDELFHDRFVSTPTWNRLKAHFSDAQCMDMVLSVGQYTQVSLFLNTMGVQLDEGQSLDPDLAKFEA